MQIYWTKINKIIEETPEVRTYLLDRPEDFTWQEGSHTHFALEGFNAGEKPNRGLIRHMSISTLPHENSIGITTRIKEQCSEFKSVLRNLEVGNEVRFLKRIRMFRLNGKTRMCTCCHQVSAWQLSARLYSII